MTLGKAINRFFQPLSYGLEGIVARHVGWQVGPVVRSLGSKKTNKRRRTNKR